MFKIPKGYENFCKPTPYCESDHWKIKKLAYQITKNKKTPEDAAKSIFNWVRDNVAWDMVRIVGARNLLKRIPMRGTCVDKVNLFIALCRAINIPARYVILFSCELNTKRFDFPEEVIHVVAEVFINNRWQMVDPTFGKNTKKVMPLSKFGKASWKKYGMGMRLKGLLPLTVLIAGFILVFLPSALKLKKLMRKARTF